MAEKRKNAQQEAQALFNKLKGAVKPVQAVMNPVQTFQRGVNTVVNSRQQPINIKPVTNAFRANAQNLGNTNLIQLGARLNPLTAGIAPLVRPSSAPTARQYFQGQIQRPLQTALNPNAGKLDRAMGAVQGGFSLTPGGTGYNVVQGQLAGLAQGIRTKQNPIPLARKATANPTSFAQTGLGVTNPIAALGIDVLAGNPKGVIKNAKDLPKLAKSFRGQGLRDANYKKVGDLISHNLDRLDRTKVDFYKMQIKEGKFVAPIHTVKEGKKFGVEDGKHRLQAYKELGYKFVPTTDDPVAARRTTELADDLNNGVNFDIPKMGIAGKKPNVANAGLYDTGKLQSKKLEFDSLVKKMESEKARLNKIDPNRQISVMGDNLLSSKDYNRMQELSGEISRTEDALRGISSQADLREIVQLKRQLRQKGVSFNEKASKQELIDLTNSRLAQPPLKSEAGLYDTKPIKVYHGGKNQGDIRDGFWVTKSPDDATEYVTGRWNNGSGKVQEYSISPKIVPMKMVNDFKKTNINMSDMQEHFKKLGYNAIDWGNGDIYIIDSKAIKKINPRVAQPPTGTTAKALPTNGDTIVKSLVGNTPPPSTPKGSVLEDIQSGFQSGREAIKKEQTQIKGGGGQRGRTQLVDKLSPVFDFMGDYKKLPAEANPYKRMRLLAGVSGKVDAFVDRTFKPVLQAEKRRDDLSALLALDREKELIGRGLKRKRSIEEVEQGYQELIAKHGEEGFKTLQDSANQIRVGGAELLDMLHDSGVISDEGFNAIKQKNGFYVPMEAVEHIADNLERGGRTGSFNVGSQDVLKGIGSYTGDVGDPLEALLRKTPKVIALAEKNKALRSLANMRNLDEYKDLIVPVVGDNVPQGMGVFNVFENGKNVQYAVPQVVEGAIKNLDAETANILSKIGGIQGNILRTGATGLNMAFIPVNIIRDVQDALTTVLTEKGSKAMMQFLGSYPRAIYSAAKKDDLFQEWISNGGAQSTMTEEIFKNTPKTISQVAGIAKGKKETIKQFVEGPKDLIQFLGRVAEQSTRISRYKVGTRKLGESGMEAALQSRDVSIDFAKNGNAVKVLNQSVPFLNAGIQGSEKLIRLYKDNPKQAIAATGILFGIPTVALYTYNQQFKDYSDIPASEKQNNWIIIARDRTQEEINRGEKVIGVKIPKGYLGRIVANTIESSMEFMQKRDPQTFVTSALDTVEGLSPVGLPVSRERVGKTLSTITPPFLKAGIESISNTNLYFGSKIVPDSLSNLPASEQYKDKTPGIYKAIGNKTNVSPLILENAVNTTTGGVGRQIASVLSGDLKEGTVGQITRRFSGIQGGVEADKAYKEVNKEKEYTALRNKQLKEAYNRGDVKEIQRLTEGMSSQQINSLFSREGKKKAQGDVSSVQRAFDSLTNEEQTRLLRERPELKKELNLIGAEAAGGNLTPKSIVSEIGGKINYIDDNGSYKTIDVLTPLTAPKLTGQSALDKTRLTTYANAFTTKINNVNTLVELGKLTPQEGNELIVALQDKQKQVRDQMKGETSNNKLTGNPTIDKYVYARIKGEQTSNVNKVIDAVQSGEISPQAGEAMINTIKNQKASGGRGGGKKGRKPRYGVAKVPKIRQAKLAPIKLGKKIKIPKYKAVKYKYSKPKKLTQSKIMVT